MSEHKHFETEYGEINDSGTYQTGSVKGPRGGGVILAILMAVLVFLIGFFSAIGLVNVRQMMQQPAPTMPLSKDTLPAPSQEDPLHTHDAPIPSIPQQAVMLALDTADPYFSQEASQQLTAKQILEQNEASLVRVYCLTHFNSTVEGIGVIMTSDGYILTNAHLVDAASRVLVELHDGQMLRAAVVGTDPFTDVAILYVNRQDLIPARFCMTSNLQVTEPIYAVERPLYGSQTLQIRTTGVFSVGRKLSLNLNSLSLVQTFHGADHGPVFNSQGQVIGLQAGRIAGYFASDDTDGLGLIIPSDEIYHVVRQLTTQGHISGRPHLGMEVEAISPLYQSYWNLPGGMMVIRVIPGSTAQEQGLQPGDILLALDGQSITSRDDLYQLLYSKEMGQQVTAVIYRDHRKFTVRLTVQELLQAAP